jgi:uncharacterized protein YcfL
VTKKTAYRPAACAAVLLFALIGCSSHADLPTEQSFIPAPTPTISEVFDNDDGSYVLRWSVDDDIAVDHYRVYSFDLFTGAPLLAGTTENTEQGIVVSIVPTGGIPLGVSAVTTQNVEGAMAIGVTPEPGP